MIRVRSRQFKQLKRWVIKHRVPLGITLGALVFVISYTTYMANKRLTVDQQSYQPLLGLIGQAESRGNYNAYFGNAGNKKVQFTTMTIQEVLAWQDSYVRQGSPSSAVGRYQFLNTTLAGLVKERAIDTTNRFDEAMQDSLAIALLERRGSEAYVNKELSKDEFAANLAKEWASLPRVTGEAPDKSYYDADGLNKALVQPKKVLDAVERISAK